MHSHILVLSWLNYDWTNLSGIEFPTQGFIEDPRYTRNRTLLDGIHGTLWGQNITNQWLNSSDKPWIVLRTERNDEIINIDSIDNFVKFKCGTVIRTGDYHECVNYILNIVQPLQKCEVM
jgi:hypothetical protein